MYINIEVACIIPVADYALMANDINIEVACIIPVADYALITNAHQHRGGLYYSSCRLCTDN